MTPLRTWPPFLEPHISSNIDLNLSRDGKAEHLGPQKRDGKNIVSKMLMATIGMGLITGVMNLVQRLISRPYLDDQAKLRTGTGQPSHALDNLPLFAP
jgi:hypothetical protein